MKPARRNAGAAIGLIVVLLTGCDNVSWGGTDIAVVPPPPKAVAVPEGSEEAGVEPLPTNPILYYVARTAEGGYMTPVGQITGDSLAPIRSVGDAVTYAGRFVAEFMRQGGEFTLFSGGRRAGTFVVHNAGVPATPTCPLLPTASGVLELSSSVTAVEFLALARSDAPSVPPRADRPEVPPGVRARIAPILAERAVRARGAALPGNWAAALEQVTAFPIGSTGTNAYAATLLVGDTLGPGMDNDGYSLFFIFTPTASQTGYDTVFVSFRSYPETGKAAPRVVDYLDWSRDGNPELLLQTFGVSGSWFESVGRGQDGVWRRTFRDRCEDGTRVVPNAVEPDSLGNPPAGRRDIDGDRAAGGTAGAAFPHSRWQPHPDPHPAVPLEGLPSHR